MRTALVLSGLLALGFVAAHAPLALAETPPPATASDSTHPLIKFTPPAHIAGQKGLEPSKEAYRVFMTIESPNFRGGKITVPVHAFEYSVTSPRDPATGQATGRRIHKPIRITTPVGSATPLLMDASTKALVLKDVTLTFEKAPAAGAGGEAKTYYKIKLTNAVIASVKATRVGGADTHEVEQIAMTFQKIEWSNSQTKATAADDWEARQ